MTGVMSRVRAEVGRAKPPAGAGGTAHATDGLSVGCWPTALADGRSRRSTRSLQYPPSPVEETWVWNGVIRGTTRKDVGADTDVGSLTSAESS